ncbi:NAD(P)H-hydrate dehydratase [Psychromarinibacter sp. C21-152]|uniref:Bifunctional NAD(P)H-hydrate repair enzyme n=1 Tax=Psychromarinibacter sediminicola TaxID=3033385 RepID=A0AAE3T9H2_9RHOB|nr:NAD(P)H-hydrate dehydratase [Psychromarinibacter sediminicola]MDF0600520.1 NAD(P)H-hydrate dehydratase [Psychromarinibacter sediminicola]
MTELLTSAQMRAIEQAAIASGEVTGLTLMERAGRGVVAAAFGQWPDLRAAPQRAVVLCGPGNNGGDGFVVARLLKERGWEVALYLFGDPEKLPPDARTNHDRWAAMGPVAPMDAAAIAAGWRGTVRLVVDAVFGTGLTRPVGGEIHAALAAIQGEIDRARDRTAAAVVAVDAPSGLCMDSGRRLRDAEGAAPVPPLPADLTVAFHKAKLGHYLAEGPAACGRVVVHDIGLDPKWNAEAEPPITRRVTEVSAAELDKRGGDHKYGYGHALVLSGGAGRGGAARMAARGALRIGAGLVTVGCPPGALQENAAQLDAVMLRSVGADADLSSMLEADDRLNALCLGPGLGTGARERQLVAAALRAGRATVLDADALTLIAQDPALFAALHEACVLTPHAGEFARLFPEIARRLGDAPTSGPAYSRLDAARAAAARAGCTVLLKGPDTVIATPDGEAVVNAAAYDRAAPWLATAGAGDVLSGFVAGLLARGLAPMRAAEAAAWLHVEAAREVGPGLIAEDLPEALPRVLRGLGL